MPRTVNDANRKRRSLLEVNNIKAHLRIQDGKITEHTDKFDIWKWSRQALGIPGTLFGWSHFMKNKIHQNAVKNLEKFMVAKEGS